MLTSVDMPYVPQQVIEKNIVIVQTANKKTDKTSSEAELKRLLQKCQEIRAAVDHKYVMMGAGNSSAHTQALKREISNYLLSIRTPVALKLLADLEESQWKGY